MNHCLNCRGPCHCEDPVVPGRDATYDPDRGCWVTWEVWRARLSRAYQSRERGGRDRIAVRAEREGRR